ncbi:Actin-related protein 7 [Orobanche gracilis]
MEDLLRHVLYTGLGWEIGNEGQVLFTDPLSTPKAVREQLVQLMFEKFNISGFYASEQAVLSLYAVGSISCCTVDVGHGKMDISSVIEGAVQHISSRRFEIGGLDLTNLFAQELGKSNPHVNLSISDVEKLKERFACCAEDDVAYRKVLQACPEEQHTLPDGKVIKIGRERYTVGEALFEPSILGMEAHGIVEQLVHCISTVSTENHRQLLENTVLCGGTASLPDDLMYRAACHAPRVDTHTKANSIPLTCSDFSACHTPRVDAQTKANSMPLTCSNFSACQPPRFDAQTKVLKIGFRRKLTFPQPFGLVLSRPPDYMPDNLGSYSAWVGGAILAKVVFPQNQHVTRADYDETGPSIVHRKCF